MASRCETLHCSNVKTNKLEKNNIFQLLITGFSNRTQPQSFKLSTVCQLLYFIRAVKMAIVKLCQYQNGCAGVKFHWAVGTKTVAEDQRGWRLSRCVTRKSNRERMITVSYFRRLIWVFLQGKTHLSRIQTVFSASFLKENLILLNHRTQLHAPNMPTSKSRLNLIILSPLNCLCIFLQGDFPRISTAWMPRKAMGNVISEFQAHAYLDKNHPSTHFSVFFWRRYCAEVYSMYEVGSMRLNSPLNIINYSEKFKAQVFPSSQGYHLHR